MALIGQVTGTNSFRNELRRPDHASRESVSVVSQVIYFLREFRRRTTEAVAPLGSGGEER
jgi:hypothetical protein